MAGHGKGLAGLSPDVLNGEWWFFGSAVPKDVNIVGYLQPYTTQALLDDPPLVHVQELITTLEGLVSAISSWRGGRQRNVGGYRRATPCKSHESIGSSH